jgi:hypothetical protein
VCVGRGDPKHDFVYTKYIAPLSQGILGYKRGISAQIRGNNDGSK